MSSKAYTFNTLSVSVPKTFVYHVELNRPKQLNAQTEEMWTELKNCFEAINVDPDCRVVVISGNGKMFTAGLDFKVALENSQELSEIEDVARKAKFLRATIDKGQTAFTSMEMCNKPVLAAVHNACIGAGVSLITAADVRYCTKDAWFQVKEVLLGITCDVGALQRLPKVVGFNGLVREICYTARKFTAEEASKIGLVTSVFEDKESMMAGVLQIAQEIASNSPVAVQGTKRSLVFSRDHSTRDGLEHVATMNQGMLQSEDFITGVTALATKQKDIEFSKL
ncbi:hypothetical protein RN001_015277 [Aquatica leii]|uniref:Delta(3,5)-Delta(2,4)-dienoyl-CoA isomerase, mitochondrial n=1 Tax=Aquatica leii TaxID=1421715 RepID=A0AAN7P1K9_9COLE|nr:hypothetical protein RN001_015277 [Aquatica leii]